MEMRLIFWNRKFYFLLLFLILWVIGGGECKISNQLIENQADTIGAELLRDMLKLSLQMFEESLVEANLVELSIEDFNCTLLNSMMPGFVHLSNTTISNWTNFHIRNLSTDLSAMKVEMDVELKLMEVMGSYDYNGSIRSIPVTANGLYSLTFSTVQIQVGGQLTRKDGGGKFFKISNFIIAPGTLNFSFDGSFTSSKLNLYYTLFYLTIVLYTIIIIVFTLFVSHIIVRVRLRNTTTFIQVPTN